MALPFFFEENISDDLHILLSENTSRHIFQVLRFKPGERLLITDGKGKIAECIVTDLNKKSTKAEIKNVAQQQRASKKIAIAISPIKNSGRLEWFLEKATEIGVNTIILMSCDHTEKLNLRYDRLKNILISAMLQSQQCWLPELIPMIKFADIVEKSDHEIKLIAHCYEDIKQSISSVPKSDHLIILIGPEGDFSKEEVAYALQHDFKPVSLGQTRLRTETAGIVAVALLKNS